MDALLEIQQRIKQAAQKADRNPAFIRLIAVSKGQPVEKIQAAYDAGQRDFGENYAQEILEKAPALPQDIEWHFLGHLQKNKIGKLAGVMAWIHSLDSLELALALDKKWKRHLPCLLEINLAGEKSKSGLSEETALALIPKLNGLTNIDLKGLMTIPPPAANPEEARPYFKKLLELLNEINQKGLYRKRLTELSMGMSDDFEIALSEGATMVRIGRAIFGERR